MVSQIATMAVQDDSREIFQRELFGLSKLEGESRGGIDAVLKLSNNIVVPFELKTTTTGSVTTVRDFGYDHVEKWKPKHWLISRYSKDGSKMEYSLYGSPRMMARWIEGKERYIKTDFDLGALVPDRITIRDMFQLLGEKQTYSLADAQRLQKKQYTKAQYEQLMDKPKGYSPDKMLQLLKDRCRYLINRGSTLNNPHIPASYFSGWERITTNHASRLRELVQIALSD